MIIKTVELAVFRVIVQPSTDKLVQVRGKNIIERCESRILTLQIVGKPGNLDIGDIRSTGTRLKRNEQFVVHFIIGKNINLQGDFLCRMQFVPALHGIQHERAVQFLKGPECQRGNFVSRSALVSRSAGKHGGGNEEHHCHRKNL